MWTYIVGQGTGLGLLMGGESLWAIRDIKGFLRQLIVLVGEVGSWGGWLKGL